MCITKLSKDIRTNAIKLWISLPQVGGADDKENSHANKHPYFSEGGKARTGNHMQFHVSIYFPNRDRE